MKIKHRREWIKAVKVLIKGYEEVMERGEKTSWNNFTFLTQGKYGYACPLCTTSAEPFCGDCPWTLFEHKDCGEIEARIQSRINRCNRWLKKLEGD